MTVQTDFVYAMLNRNADFKRLGLDRQGEICIAIVKHHWIKAMGLTKCSIVKAFYELKGE